MNFYRKTYIRLKAILSSAEASIFFKAMGITLLAFLLSKILLAPFSFSASSLVSAPEKNDFEMTDFYSIVADSRLVRTLDKDVVIINIDYCDRRQIAEALESLAACQPAVIGLDVMFAEPRDDDSALLDAISGCENLVMPLGVRDAGGGNFELSDTTFFFSRFSDTPHGVTNLPTKYPGGTVREFKKFFPLPDGTQLPAFSVAVVKEFSPDTYRRLAGREEDSELINFPSHDYRVYLPDEIADNVENIHGKIALVGAMSEQPDLHSTPIHSQMAGIAIHARAVSTILNDDYLSKASYPVDWLLAFLLCLLVVYASLRMPAATKGLTLRLLQIGLVYILLVAGYTLFVEHNLIIDISFALLMLMFGLFACDVWNGSLGIADLISEKLRMHRSKKKKVADKTE